MTNLGKRFVTGFIGGGIMVSSILLSEYSFSALFLFIVVMSLWEFYSWCEKNAMTPQKYLGIIIGALVFLFFSLLNFNPRLILVLILPLLFSIFIRELYTHSEKPFVNIAVTILGIVYLALPMALMCLVSQAGSENNSGIYHPGIVLGYLFLVWSHDIGAYFAGKRYGKRKLFERISPKKTWEGSAGGLVFSLAVAVVISIFVKEFRLVDWIFIDCIIVVTGTLGDLVESMFKRSIHIKDSGEILPGHGGFLDRFDSFFISVPFVFTYLQLVY